MGKYRALAEEIVEKVGGAGNIAGAAHCMTRLRLKLRDESKANDEAIKNISGVISLVKSAGQYQIVIGTHVGDVYEDVCAVAGVTGEGSVEAAPDEVDDLAPKQKMSPGAVVLDYLSGMMGPLIAVICGCGIIKGILSIISYTGLLADTDTLYQVLEAAGDCVYYFMPILFGYTLAKKMKMSPVLGMGLGMILVYPDLQNMEGASLFGIDVSGISYSQSMLPIVMVMLVAVPFDRLLKRILPKSLESFLEPAILFIIMAPLAFTVIGPVMMVFSNAIAQFVQAIMNVSPILTGLVVCAAWQVLVLCGVHVVLASVIFTLMFATGSSMLYPLTCIPGFAVFGVALAMYLRTKDQQMKDTALPATFSSFMGVTEPAIYGLLLPHPAFFALVCVVSGIAGAYMGLTGVTAYTIGGSGLLCLTIVMQPGDPTGLINFSVAIAFAAIASFVVAFIMYRDKKPAQGSVATA